MTYYGKLPLVVLTLAILEYLLWLPAPLTMCTLAMPAPAAPVPDGYTCYGYAYCVYTCYA